jgi:hypothetical protein
MSFHAVIRHTGQHTVMLRTIKVCGYWRASFWLLHPRNYTTAVILANCRQRLVHRPPGLKFGDPNYVLANEVQRRLNDDSHQFVSQVLIKCSSGRIVAPSASSGISFA